MISPDGGTVSKGASVQFTATGTFTDGSRKPLASVTWTTSAPNVATIDAAGMATGMSLGNATIQVSSGSIKASTSLTVTAATIVSITVSPTGQAIPAGANLQFSATGHFSDGSTQVLSNATWSSSDTTTATINSSGLVTGVKTGGPITITAASGGIISGPASLTVTSAVLQTITVTPNQTSVAAGNNVQFTATGQFSDGSNQVLSKATWNSSDKTIATINSSGLATGVKTGGPITITAASGGINGTASLSVTPAVLQSITVTPNPAGTVAGNTVQFTATGHFSDGSTPVLSNATWSSSDTTIARINSSSGLATGVKAGGPITITAASGGINGIASLTVTPPALQSITVTPNPAGTVAGNTVQFTATGHFSDGSTQALSNATWKSSDTTIATIDSSGLATGVKAGGPVTITATSSGINGSANLTVTSASSLAGVFTQHNDNMRTGQNLNETALTPGNVNSTSFGKLFSLPVDGYVYAQPLYKSNVSIAGGTHNIVYVTTEGDSVYAFDADTGGSLWQVSLIDTAHGATLGETTVNIQNDLDPACTDVIPQVGITSTPVIDPSGSGTMYVEAKSKKSDGTWVHRLHRLDVTNGVEISPGPVDITATVPGTSDGGSTITFDPLRHLNRPGLLLVNGTVYLGYASHCDSTPYHGWVFAYDASTLAQTAAYITTPNGQGQGGIWMSGAGLSADSSGNIFVATGNGNYDATDVGDSILKLALNGNTISLADYFTPFDQFSLDGGDVDVASGGVLLLPDQPGNHAHELVQAGKEGRVYVVDRDQMTVGNQHYCANCSSDPEIVQESGPLQVGTAGSFAFFAMPAYWNNTVYFWGVSDTLKAIPLSNGTLDFTHIATSQTSYGFPGATPSISANGSANGIVWSIDSSQYGTPGPGPGPAVLHAHDANTLTELWNSSLNGLDTAGNAVKFAVPTIANGKVYIGTETEVDVYGLH